MRIRAVLTVFLSFLVLAIALVSGSILLTRLFFVGVGLIVFSYVWSHLSLTGIQAKFRRFTERPQVGTFLISEVSIENLSTLPKLLTLIREEGDLPGYKNGRVVNLRGKDSLSWESRYYCRRRGKYNLGPLSVESDDPFGLFPRNLKFGEVRPVTVYPATFELPFASVGDGERPTRGKITSQMNEAIPNVSRIREYTSSDNLNRIHWRGTAHLGRLMVKVFDGEWSELAMLSKRSRGGIPGSVWIIPDMLKNPADLESGASEEICVTVAASIVKRFRDSGKAAGLIAEGGKPYFLPPEPGDGQYLRIMEALSEIDSGNIPVSQLISEHASRMYPGAQAIVVTSSADDRTQTALRRLGGDGVITTLVLIRHYSLADTPEVQDMLVNMAANGITTYIASFGEKGTVGANAFRLPVGDGEKEIRVWRVTRKERELHLLK